MVQLPASTSSRLPSPLLIPEGAKAKAHIILFLSSPSHPTSHSTPPPLPHPPCTSVAASEISLCASVEAAAGEFTSPSVSLKCIPSLGQLAVRRLDPGDLCRSTVRTCAHTHVCAATCMWPATNGSQVGKREEEKKAAKYP